MTKLQQKIKEAILAMKHIGPFPADAYTKAAAEVAKKYIIQALNDSYRHSLTPGDIAKTMHYQDWVRTWLKESGITE